MYTYVCVYIYIYVYMYIYIYIYIVEGQRGSEQAALDRIRGHSGSGIKNIHPAGNPWARTLVLTPRSTSASRDMAFHQCFGSCHTTASPTTTGRGFT